MEIVILIVGIIILMFLINQQKEAIRSLDKNLFHTHDLLQQLQKKIEQLAPEQPIEEKDPSISVDKPISAFSEPEITATEESIPLHEETLASVPPPLPPIDQELPKGTDISVDPEEPDIVREHFNINEPIRHQTQGPATPRLSWFERFKQNNPDVERFIGENLVNKIGILILVLGISYFVKYAIDREWINEPMRVGIGILSGGILLGIAHRLRQKYQAFSSVFVAGGIAVFYFTIGIAFQDYQLFSQTAAFIIMVLITVFSAFVSIAYNRQELGILTIIGGFSVPFIVSTDSGNYHVLFTYLAILNVGMLTVSYYKRWHWANFTAFLLTLSIYTGWYLFDYFANKEIYLHALGYAALFYIIFSIAFVLNNVKTKNKFANYEIGAIILNTFCFYGFGLQSIQSYVSSYAGLFTLGLAMYNLVYAGFIFRNYKFDKSILYVLIGLALTFATITVPTQFEGNYITLFWACEAVLLFWLTKKSHLKGFTIAGIIVQGLAFISLLMDWLKYQMYQVDGIFVFNNIFLTGLVAIGSFLLTHRLFKTYDFQFKLWEGKFNPVFYRKFVFAFALILGYIVPILDIQFFVYNDLSYNSGTNAAFIYLFHMLYSAALVFFGLRSAQDSNYRLVYYLIALNVMGFIFIGYRFPIQEIEEVFYSDGNPQIKYAFFLHYVSLLCLVYQIWVVIRASIQQQTPALLRLRIMPWLLTFAIVYICSVEANIHFLHFTTDFDSFYRTKSFVIKVIFPILWGTLSFVFLIYGVRQNVKTVRIIALSLLGLTILKLFVYDITEVSETGKIIAFILLGILILVISFVYQKIKKLVVDNETTNNEKDS